MEDPIDVVKMEIERVRVKNEDPSKDDILLKAAGPNRGILFGLHGRDLDGGEAKQNLRFARQRRAHEEFAKLDVAEQDNFIKAMFPELGRWILDYLALQSRQPINRYSFTQRAFRLGKKGEQFSTQEERRAIRTESMTLLVESLLQFRSQDVIWVAEHLAFLGWATNYYRTAAWAVLVPAMNAGTPESARILQILDESIRGVHPIGQPSSNAYAALMACDLPEAWEIVEKLLLGAQREEGLRQQILEIVDLSHPTAFRRMLKLLLDENMIRFSSVARAVDVWLGLNYDSQATRPLVGAMNSIHRFLSDRNKLDAGLKSDNPQEVYFALWSLAFDDVGEAMGACEVVLRHENPEHRFAAVLILSQARLTATYRLLVPLVDDPDLRVAYMAAILNRSPTCEKELAYRARMNFEKWPKRKDCGGFLFPWIEVTIERSAIANKLVPDDEENLLEALPYLHEASSACRGRFIGQLRPKQPKPRDYREFLLQLSGDSTAGVPQQVYGALRALKPHLEDSEWIRIEENLKRKTSELRKHILDLALSQPDEQVIRTASRLAESKALPPRTAALEILRRLVDAKRLVNECKVIAEGYKARFTTLTEEEERQLASIYPKPSSDSEVTWALENGFGLFSPADLTTPVRPEKKLFRFVSPAAARCLQALDDLVHENREVPIKTYGEDSEPLGNVRWGFHGPNFNKTLEEDVENFQLRDVWETWFTERSAELRDEDGLELVRAKWSSSERGFPSIPKNPTTPRQQARAEMFADFAEVKLKYPHIVHPVLSWLVRISADSREREFLTEAGIQVIARIEKELLIRPANEQPENHWERDTTTPRNGVPGKEYIRGLVENVCRDFVKLPPDTRTQIWNALHWADVLPLPDCKPGRCYPPLYVTLQAWRDGNASEADLVQQLLYIPPRDRSSSGRYKHNDLAYVSCRKTPVYANLNELDDRERELISRVVDRVVEVELARGEKESATTSLTLTIGNMEGSQRLARVIKALGKLNLKRDIGGWNPDNSREEGFSHLIRVTFPSSEDLADPVVAASRLKSSGATEERLIEVALFAPQWARIVDNALGWKGLESAVWWFRAHTKDTQWSVPDDIKERWAADLAERTELSPQDLLDGAVDVAWFHECHGPLGNDRWDILHKAAKYSCSNIGHSRARIYGDALRGGLTVKELTEQIESKRNLDRVRALGLVPLDANSSTAEADVLVRYEALEEFVRTSKQFGSQRRASEARAAEIAMDNLARTAGFADPLRLRWAMETKAMSDLASGSKTVVRGDVSVTLKLDELGEAEILVEKNGKAQKSVPASIKKDPEIVELGERKGALRKQVARVRRSLESAMVRGDEFKVGELRALSAHPLLAPMLTSLVFLNQEGQMGWLSEGSTELLDNEGAGSPLDPGENLRLAHPCDLFACGEWSRWQRDCFRREIVQPFKQVFRELYLLTDREKESERHESSRYAGHQLQPRQAMALLGTRGWVASHEEGVRRTWFRENINAWIQFEEGYFTPAEVEGLTMGTVHFTNRGDWKNRPLKDVPPRLFSETMRDLDLVVSVAHRASVDPESSESSIEARAALVRETAGVLKLGNVRVEGRHAFIHGELAEYSLHLGSAEAAVLPGGHLFIVAVHAAHRGRLFLPFVDDDPKSAELVSKMLMLARDKEIKDPGIRQQISSLRK